MNETNLNSSTAVSSYNSTLKASGSGVITWPFIKGLANWLFVLIERLINVRMHTTSHRQVEKM